MRVEMTHRANIAFEKAQGDLKRRLTDVLNAFERGSSLPPEQLRSSKARPGVSIVKINDYRLFFERENGVIRVLDIIPRSEAYK
jgi:hypothetical protein